MTQQTKLFLGDCTTFCLRVATKARTYSLGPLHPSFKVSKILRDALRETLPENAHEICSGKLFISMTRVSDRQSVIISEYDSKEEVIQVNLTSNKSRLLFSSAEMFKKPLWQTVWTQIRLLLWEQSVPGPRCLLLYLIRP